jgi:hypothetical protein
MVEASGLNGIGGCSVAFAVGSYRVNPLTVCIHPCVPESRRRRSLERCVAGKPCGPDVGDGGSGGVGVVDDDLPFAPAIWSRTLDGQSSELSVLGQSLRIDGPDARSREAVIISLKSAHHLVIEPVKKPFPRATTTRT